MKPSHEQKKLSGSHKYTEDQLIRKISGIIQKGKFVFSNGEIATEKELLTFMYKINFLVARKDMSDGGGGKASLKPPWLLHQIY